MLHDGRIRKAQKTYRSGSGTLQISGSILFAEQDRDPHQGFFYKRPKYIFPHRFTRRTERSVFQKLDISEFFLFVDFLLFLKNRIQGKVGTGNIASK